MIEKGYKIRNQEALHFLTFSIVYWIDIFTRQNYRDIIIENLRYCQQHKKLTIYSFVIMTNHIHVILRSINGTLSNTIRDFKSYTSKQLINEIKECNESRKDWMLYMFEAAAKKHKRNSKYQVWTHYNHPIELDTNEMIDQRLNYVHDNPVKAGFVANPEDYIYSSASNYVKGYGLLEVELID